MKMIEASRRTIAPWAVLPAVLLAAILALSGAAPEQDKWALTAPNGLTFGFIKGYESYAFVAAHYRKDIQEMHLIFGNPKAMAAYADGAGENGKPFPDGATLVKIGYSLNPDPGFAASIEPDTLRRVEFITRDSVRFKDTGNWGYARFVYDAASGSFSPFGTDKDFAKACFACHTLVAKRDFIFTRLVRR
jgi:hypothetical protein